MKDQWKRAMRDELTLGLTVFVDDGAFEMPATLRLDYQEGVLDMTWSDDSRRRCVLTIRRDTLITLAEAMRKP